jgi:hypothetical protein
MLRNFKNKVVRLIINRCVCGNKRIVDVRKPSTLRKFNVDYGAKHLNDLSFSSKIFCHIPFLSLFECLSAADNVEQLIGDSSLA